VGGTGFTKTGFGTLTLAGDNTYTGTVSVTGGMLELSGNNSNASAAVKVFSDATLQLASPEAVRGALTLNNHATLQLRANNDGTFAPSSISLQNFPNVNYFDVNSEDGLTSGKTLTLAGALFFPSIGDNTIQVTGGHDYTLALGAISAASSSRPVFRVNAAPGIAVALDSFTAGPGGHHLDLTGGGKVIITGDLGSTGFGGVVLFVNGASLVTLRGRSVPSDRANRFFVPNGTLVVDHSDAVIDNTTGNMDRKSLFILGPATKILDFGYSLPSGFLIASNNVLDCAVLLGDSDYSSGGLTLAANVTNFVSDGGLGFSNFGTMILGGQNSSGTNTYANRIVLGWTPDRGKSVTLVAATGGEVDFVGDIVRNGADTSAGATVGNLASGGTVRLAGTNTYLGDTKIVNGALVVDGSLGGGVVVQSGGTLGGSGTINGPVIVQSGSLLSLGHRLDALNLKNSLVLASGSQVSMAINASSGAVIG
jgi:autotransporter-associated beta strand protein